MDCFLYWGKADQLNNYHLLVYHCLDVAAVGKVWLERSPEFAKRASFACGLSKKAFREWFLFFLALHDIGKFDVRFQNLRPDILYKLQKRMVNIPYSPRHDQRGFEYYEDFLFNHIHSELFADKKKHILKSYLDVFAYNAFGHHGIPPKADNIRKIPEAVCNFSDDLIKLFLTNESFAEISKLLELPKKERKEKTAGLKHFSWQLAGLTTLCDWIASGDEAFVHCSTKQDLKDYFKEACQKAVIAVKRAEIVETPLSEKQGMSCLFPKFADTPTPLQKFCNETHLTGEPQLWILEDVTGAGKTEAALTLASRILGAGGGTGCFVALPTMATANAMYERMAEVYFKIYKDNTRPSLTLIHGSRHLSDRFRNSYCDFFRSIPHNGEIADEDRDEGKTHCSQWLADSSKKALLADVGVGTVDQLLLAGLPVRYQSLRAFGMGQKVLIIDEVHAFDAYMLRLLENIITAHAAFGGSLILLSATLPFLVRKKFCKAFSSGLSSKFQQIQQKELFPLVTTVSAREVREIGVKTREFVSREVDVDFCENVMDVYSLIEASVADAKCVCWIRNTIADVTASFNELLDRGLKNIDIFHSRFALNDRLNIENRVLKRFGGKSKPDERRGQILIASQVVEQSLDLDFDVMISDLAPVDLLIQRAGRLHRHDRGNRAKPVFYVHIPEDTEEPSIKWYEESFPQAKWVYKDIALLWRTKEILKQQKRLKMPEEARLLVESVYGEDEAIATPDVFTISKNEAWSNMMNDKSIADSNRLKFDQGYCRMSSTLNKWESEERVSTRLSEETNKLYLCRWIDGNIVPLYNDKKYPWDLSSLSLRKDTLMFINYDEEIQFAIEALQNKQKRFKYETLFLVFCGDDLKLTGLDKYDREVNVIYSKDVGLIVERVEK